MSEMRREAEALGKIDLAALRVLVVDDNEISREINSALMRFAGYQVMCAPGGAEAVQAAAMNDFDVVLMDVRMAGTDGFEATRQIRRLEGARGQVQILALTALALAEQVQMCREVGMNGHVGKPVAPEALLAVVAESAARGQRARAH